MNKTYKQLIITIFAIGVGLASTPLVNYRFAYFIMNLSRGLQ